ncbi:hypothetical protein CORC01_02290 [Colletotrichum orchidophilum]|uniref:Uncharacterized protein n=1 Tax=Colletotrichum orchidophilum TaxID=1209926 RepID=A0A1G4BLX0_9PEZI|nr:uncharacterized protein CORC01_02290 [Colletotrichum orchidophilum]OHF02297.1 hypothetical protein CORC01_02290 [Colletotrichum orchidophilum]
MSFPTEALQYLSLCLNVRHGIRQCLVEILPNPTDQKLDRAFKTIEKYLQQQHELGQNQYQASLNQASASLGVQCGILQELLTRNGEFATQLGDMTGVLRSISTDLKSFTKPGVFGQIVEIGGLATGNAAVAQIQRLADQAEKMAMSLDKIGDNMYSENSRGDKFPGHVHSFIRSMIEKHQEEKTPHYFFVFNQSTTWHAKFDDIKRADPLGDHFLGYSHDLDELVAFIVEDARPRLGSEPIVHILIPTISQLAIIESLTFPEGMGPFCVTGQLGESGLPFVYLCTPLDRANLRHIGSLMPKPRWMLRQQVGLCLPIVHQWLSTHLEPVYFEDPYFQSVVFASLWLYESDYTPVEPGAKVSFTEYKFKKVSREATEQLDNGFLLSEETSREVKLVMDNTTRWNPTSLMIKRAIQL